MPGTKERGETIRRFILDNVDSHPCDIAAFTAEHFGISRQAAHGHLRRLVAEKAVAKIGSGNGIRYNLVPQLKESFNFPLKGLDEETVWHETVRPLLAALPRDVRNIWHYGVTEMLNNAIDHSGGGQATVDIAGFRSHTRIIIADDGIGIFKRLQTVLGLQDQHHAVLELAKGKVTTDPARHSGQGIFFSSRAFDKFFIVSGGITFTHHISRHEDWILESDYLGTSTPKTGTFVFMKLSNHSTKKLKNIFDDFTTKDGEFNFNKTVVPVALAKYGDENLVSRSQAKRLLARIDSFDTVILDFTDVEEIGQAFADEVFRVFKNQHQDMQLLPINACEDVQKMIDWVSASR